MPSKRNEVVKKGKPNERQRKTLQAQGRKPESVCVEK